MRSITCLEKFLAKIAAACFADTNSSVLDEYYFIFCQPEIIRCIWLLSALCQSSSLSSSSSLLFRNNTNTTAITYTHTH